jgi:TatA/E family protein of Tat protein translocase
MMVILLIVFFLFGAKKLPELARGMGRAVKEFTAARDEADRELSQSGLSPASQAKLLDQTRKSQPPRFSRAGISNEIASGRNSIARKSSDITGGGGAAKTVAPFI